METTLEIKKSRIDSRRLIAIHGDTVTVTCVDGNEYTKQFRSADEARLSDSLVAIFPSEWKQEYRPEQERKRQHALTMESLNGELVAAYEGASRHRGRIAARRRHYEIRKTAEDRYIVRMTIIEGGQGGVYGKVCKVFTNEADAIAEAETIFHSGFDHAWKVGA